MTQDTAEIRALARDFAAAELRPHTEAWDAHRAFEQDTVARLAELGFFGMLIAEADGGMGFDTAVYAAALEELAWGEAGVALLVAQSSLAADFIGRFGNAEQKGEWLGAMAAGELIGCVAFSEDDPDAPFDALRTRAVAEGDGWRLTGRKRWVTAADRAGLAVVLAATDAGAALFVVPRDAGLATGKPGATMGMRSVTVADLDLDARLEAAHHLADLHEDPRRDADTLGRISTAAIAVGIAQAALEHALRYAAEREQFGQPIRTFAGIRDKLAQMATQTRAARALLASAAADPSDAAAAATAKLAAADAAMHVTTEAVQIFGGYGYMRDYPVEKLMRDAKATQIVHGSAASLKHLIADALYE